MAPEIFSNRGYTEKVDIFSSGIILYTMLNGSPPFTGQNVQTIVKKTYHEKIKFTNSVWTTVTPSSYLSFLFTSIIVRTLILKMTEKNPSMRISLSELLHLFENRNLENISPP